VLVLVGESFSTTQVKEESFVGFNDHLVLDSDLHLIQEV